MNFFDFMRNTFVTNEPVWNYYGTEIYTDPVASPGRSAQFIQDYFLQGQKGDIVYELDAHHDVNIHGISLLLSEYRATHTVSAFFLGIFLEDCLTQGQCGADLAVHGDFFPFSYSEEPQYSVDKYYRLSRGWSWWPDEQPSPEIKAYVEQQIREKHFDIVLSHTCPFKYEPTEMFLGGIDQRTVDDSTERWLDTIEESIQYKAWFCGHWHTDKRIDKMHFLFRSFESDEQFKR